MPFFIIAFYPKKSAAANGAVPLATCIDSKNAKLAEMKATMALEEYFPDTTDNFFKPKICELTANINGRPPVDGFSEHWLTCNVWDEENKTFEHIPTTTTIEDTADELDPLAGAETIADLPFSARVAYVAMYGAETNELDMEQVSNAIDMVSDDEAPEEMKAFITGLSGIPALQQMFPERLAVLIDTMRAQMPPFDSVNDVRKFAEKWVAEPSKREEKAPGAAELARTYETLDLEVALHVMGINPDEAKASHIRDAKYLKDNRDPAWRGWATSLRVVPGILDIPRGELWELMADGHKDLKLIEDADGRRDYVSSKLHGHPLLPDYQPEVAKVQNLGGGKFSIEGLAVTGTSNEVEKTEVVEEKTSVHTNKDTVENSLTETKPAEPASIAPKSETIQAETASEKANPALPENAVTTAQDDFRDRAEQIVGEIMKMPQAAQDNLSLWRQVHKTDEKFTKAFANNGGGTSINGTYMIMQATRVFGPQGINWGVDILEERFDIGAPIMRSVKGADGNFIKEIIPNGAGGYLTEINHTTKILLWYRTGDKRGEVISYGCTPYVQNTRNGVISDGEAPKKSLTDATKKALSQLGFSADVFLGLFDDQEYRAENKMQHELINASEKGEEVVRMRKELDEKFAANTETMKTAVTANEVTKIASSLNRTIGVHLKNAKAVNDTEHARYLETRLRRLEEIKTECLNKFTNQGEAA